MSKTHVLVLAFIVVVTIVMSPAAAGKDIRKIEDPYSVKAVGFAVFYEDGTDEIYSGRVLEDNTVEWFDGSHFYKRVATYESEFVGQESGAVLDGYVRRMEQKTDNGQRMYKWDVHGVVTFPDGTFRKYHSVFHAILDENNTLKQYIDHYNWAG